MRGRGNGGRIGKRPGGSKPMTYIPRLPFDLTLCEETFPRVTPALNDDELTQAILKRNQMLTPSAAEQSAVLNLVTKVQSVIDNMIVAPPANFDTLIEEVRQVGSHKKGTMMAGNNVADMVIVLKTLPTVEAVQGLGNKILELLRVHDPKESRVLTMQITDSGFEFHSKAAVNRCLVATLPSNLSSVEPNLHLDFKIMKQSLAAIRHTKWFEDNNSQSSVKVLIRILKDLRVRFCGLEPLHPWLIDLLSNYCILNTLDRQPLAINVGFRRTLKVLAAGMFLPGSAGVSDPCEGGGIRAHVVIPLEDQDMMAYTAQTLLRVLSHGGFKNLLGLDAPVGRNKKQISITMEMSVWNGVVITPSDKAYENPPPEPAKTDAEDKDDMDTEAIEKA